MQLTDYTQPTPLVKTALAAVKPGRVLDVGSFTGRNALYLARLGWEVTAIDTDAAVLKTLRDTATSEHLSIVTQQADVRTYRPEHQFDAILCLMVLHFLPEKDIAPAINNMRSWTKPHGLNIVSAFTAGNPAGTRPYLFPAGQLKDLYSGWGIANYDESYSSWIVPEGKTEPERYTVARLVAQRVAD